MRVVNVELLGHPLNWLVVWAGITLIVYSVYVTAKSGGYTFEAVKQAV